MFAFVLFFIVSFPMVYILKCSDFSVFGITLFWYIAKHEFIFGPAFFDISLFGVVYVHVILKKKQGILCFHSRGQHLCKFIGTN